MSNITLVRHGQANSGSTDETSYDKLSDLGHQQARWLGSYLTDIRETYDRVYCGTLTRHIETAAGMGFDSPTIDARLNELTYFNMSDAVHKKLGIAVPTNRDEFIEHLPLVFTMWQEGQIEGDFETFHAFQSRIDEVLHDIAAGNGRALIVTSGGVIAMSMRIAMGLEMSAFSRTALAIMNTSLHQLHPIGDSLSMTQFNAVPHLASPERQFAKTFV